MVELGAPDAGLLSAPWNDDGHKEVALEQSLALEAHAIAELVQQAVKGNGSTGADQMLDHFKQRVRTASAHGDA
jgi:hypothetical protein